MKDFSDFGISIPAGRGGEVATTCPQCSPHRKNAKARCLSVNVEKGVWKCNHCDWRGTLHEGVRERSNPWAHRTKTFAKPTYDAEGTADISKALAWFAKRGIPAEVVRRNRITVGQVWMPQVEAEVSAIRLPYYRNGEVINVKSRDAAKNFRMESGAERILYGLDDCANCDTIIFVEGEIDKLSVEVAGYKNCMSVPDGAPSPNTREYAAKFSFLESAEEQLATAKRIIIAVDNDAPGQKLEEELARRLGQDRCSRVTWPDGCKDANDVLVKCGPDALKDCINSAKPYPVEGLFDVGDFATDIDRMYQQGLPPGDKPGWPCLNRLITFHPGMWTAVTGIPGHGKSEMIDAIAVNLATNYDWTFAIFSPENQPLALHFQKIAEKYIGKPFFNTGQPGTQRMTPQNLEVAKTWIAEHFTFVLPPSDNLSVESVLKLARTAVLRKGVKGIVIDPWNELDHTRPASFSETDYISAALTKIRRFARENGVHVWLVAHPAKMKKERDQQGNMVYPVPTPYDISGSAHWRNKADNAITVYRDVTAEYGLVQVHVQKVRFKHCGRVGVAELRYDRLTGRYSDPQRETATTDIIDLDDRED